MHAFNLDWNLQRKYRQIRNKNHYSRVKRGRDIALFFYMGGIDQSFLAQYYKEERIGMIYFSCRAYDYYLKKTINYN